MTDFLCFWFLIDSKKKNTETSNMFFFKKIKLFTPKVSDEFFATRRLSTTLSRSKSFGKVSLIWFLVSEHWEAGKFKSLQCLEKRICRKCRYFVKTWWFFLWWIFFFTCCRREILQRLHLLLLDVLNFWLTFQFEKLVFHQTGSEILALEEPTGNQSL